MCYRLVGGAGVLHDYFMIFRASAGSVVRGRQSSPTCSRQCHEQAGGAPQHRRSCIQCEQGTGKAGENGQHSRTVGRLTRTRPSVARLLLVDLWESSLGVIAIDWVAGRSILETELLEVVLNVQSGCHKKAPRGVYASGSAA